MPDFALLHATSSAIPVDIGGGSAFDKIMVMAGLAERLGLRTYVEIGVYRGRSFFPIAASFSQRNGFSYGIDPYTRADAEESDLPISLAATVQQFFEETDYDALYREVLGRQVELGLLDCTEFIRQPSQAAVHTLGARNISPEMVHIDGNHDTLYVMQDVQSYIPILKPGGILVLDDIDWDSVKPAFEYAKARLALIYSTDTYAVLIKSDADDRRRVELQAECQRLEEQALAFLDGHAADANKEREPLFKVSVSMITYNQEAYIARAIESALEQQTDFPFEIVIGDDNSSDSTRTICRLYQSRYPDRIRLVERAANIGAVRNYLDTYEACNGRYVAFLEGDDFWISPHKLQKQADFLDTHPDYAICFHNVLQTDHTSALGEPLFDKLPDTTTVRDLCTGDYISTPSCMIRNRQVTVIPEWLYELPGCDWAFDILNAECGKIKCLPDTMAAYRTHGSGIWSGLSPIDKARVAINLAMEMNRRLEFRYDKEFIHYIARNRMWLEGLLEQKSASDLEDIKTRILQIEHRLSILSDKSDDIIRKVISSRSPLRRAIRSARHALKPQLKRLRKNIRSEWAKLQQASLPKFDLVIVDDAYPHPQSAFRLEEYDTYLSTFRNSLVYTSGRAFSFFNESRTLAEVIAAHEQDARFRNKVVAYDPQGEVRGRVAYSIFAGNTWTNIEFFERNKLPFVFTLYPGGAFFMDDPASDERLRRIFSSPMFRQVIVTQRVTMDYLLKRNFCSADRIHFIYGVVTPRINLKKEPPQHRHFGFGKDTLDICFTAHKYTPDGHDKGYDIFLEVARNLAQRLPECRFHVVGGFSADDLPISGLEGKITFYGGQTQEWLAQFYQDKDLILSCNVPFIIRDGAFDGFPTGCGTDAMLNTVALFCTDPLGLNGSFVDGQDLVIVPHDENAITEKLTWYRDNPAALRELAVSGRRAALKIYSFERQMMPRIEILRSEMGGLRAWFSRRSFERGPRFSGGWTPGRLAND